MKKVVTKKAAPKAVAKKVTFHLVAPMSCRVFVAGSFNGWSDEEHALKFVEKHACFQTVLSLAPGRYEYKFVVDGSWVVDPGCADWVPNEYGSLNSVIVV